MSEDKQLRPGHEEKWGNKDLTQLQNYAMSDETKLRPGHEGM